MKTQRFSILLEKADENLVPVIVIGELYAGFNMGKVMARNAQELELFLSKPGITCAEISRPIAERYGLLIDILKPQGTPITTNDVWVSAVTLETGARLLSYDAHFQKVPGIAVIGF
jgi:tRNA(fMet)-specific endonuclease VapC